MVDLLTVVLWNGGFVVSGDCTLPGDNWRRHVLPLQVLIITSFEMLTIKVLARDSAVVAC